MANKNAKTRRVSGRQLIVLFEYLRFHKDLAVAFNRSLQAKEHAKKKWQEIADLLNAQDDGAHRDWKGWSKYWVDYKAKLKRRVATLSQSQETPSTELPLSTMEKKFLKILGEDCGSSVKDVQEPFPIQRRCKREPEQEQERKMPISHVSARQSFVQSAERKAQAAVDSNESLEGIRHSLANINDTLKELCNIARSLNTVFTPASE